MQSQIIMMGCLILTLKDGLGMTHHHFTWQLQQLPCQSGCGIRLEVV